MVDVEEMFDGHVEIDDVLLHAFNDLCSAVDHEGSEVYVDLDGCDVYLLIGQHHVRHVLVDL